MKSNRLQLMSEGNVSRSLFQLGMPMVVSMLITALYNVVDTYFVSGLGKQAVAAVSVAFPISLVFSGIGLTFGAGAGSYISRLLGKKEKEMADRVACVALFSSIGVGIVVAALGLLFLAPALSLFSDDAQVLAIAVPALRANTIMFFTFGLQFTDSTLYLAIGKALVGGALNICRQGIMFIPVILIFPALWGMNGVIWSQAAADILTSFVTVYFAVRIHRRLEMCE